MGEGFPVVVLGHYYDEYRLKLELHNYRSKGALSLHVSSANP